MLFEPLLAELVVDDVLDHRPHFRRDQLVLGLAELNFGSGTLTDSTQVRPSRDIVTGDGRPSRASAMPRAPSAYLPTTCRVSARAQARQVRAAIALRDVVGEAQDVLVVAVIPPHRDFDGDAVASR
jgi:hypothetical protein